MRFASIALSLILFGLFFAEPKALAQVQVSVLLDTQPAGGSILVIGALLATSNLAQTTLTFTFPGPISTTASGIQLLGASGVFATGTTISSNPQAGTIQVTLPGVASNSSSGSFRIVGFNSPGFPCGLINAALSSSVNNYLLSLPVVPVPLVITSVTTSKQILQIHGTGAFCSPQVVLGETQLTGVVPIPGGVRAILPAHLTPGTYLLRVSRSFVSSFGAFGDSSTFDVAIGLVGSKGSGEDR